MRIDGRGLLRILLGLILVSPYLIWLTFIGDWPAPSRLEFWPVLRDSIEQAALSTLFSLLAGFVLMLGLFAWERRTRAELFLLAPSLVPPLYLVSARLGLASAPPGLFTVVGVHIWLCAGLVAVALARLVEARLSGAAEAAWTMGASRLAFWRRIAWPLVRLDVLYLTLFIFSVCLTSFSIPVLLGGSRALSLEIAIYNAIRMEGRWDHALSLALIQGALLLTFAFCLPRSALATRRREGSSLEFLRSKFARHLVVLPSALLASGWVLGLGEAPSLKWPTLVPAAMLSLAIGLAVGFAHLFLFSVTAFVSPHERLARFLNGYLAPGAVITAFGLMLVGGPSGAKLCFALTLSSFALLYRWQVESSLSELNAQIAVARTLSAGWWDILGSIVWPQAGPVILRASAIGGVWASGDYAVSGILLSNDPTLSLLVRDAIAHYEFSNAAYLLLPLVVVAALIYLFFNGASRYVCR